jgi:DNA repair exonuclease SbcCD ATPase subunit
MTVSDITPENVSRMLAQATELREFLDGTGPLEGRWFGEPREPAFFWRKYLKRIDAPLEDLAARLAEVEARKNEWIDFVDELAGELDAEVTRSSAARSVGKKYANAFHAVRVERDALAARVAELEKALHGANTRLNKERDTLARAKQAHSHLKAKHRNTLSQLAGQTRLAAKETARLAEYEAKLSEVMPVDFKDWHENDRSEWPSLAAWALVQWRDRAEAAEPKVARLTEALDSTLNSFRRFYYGSAFEAEFQYEIAALAETKE